MQEKKQRKYKKQPLLCMKIDGCQVTVYFAQQQERSILEEIKRMILSGLKK